MRKIDVLSMLTVLVGGLLSLGDGIVVGVPLLVASAYLLARQRIDPTRKRLTAAVAALAG
jgi:hypothetical protein